MKLHTKLLPHEISDAFRTVKDDGDMTADIEFVQFDAENSRSHDNGYKIQLGTYDPKSGPKNSRYHKNSGQYGASDIWAATYDEWGCFVAEIFSRDPGAKFGSYDGVDDFNAKTEDRYC